MSLPTSKGYYTAEAAYAPLLREIGLVDAMSVFVQEQLSSSTRGSTAGGRSPNARTAC